jgi:hypothetical protein
MICVLLSTVMSFALATSGSPAFIAPIVTPTSNAMSVAPPANATSVSPPATESQAARSPLAGWWYADAGEAKRALACDPTLKHVVKTYLKVFDGKPITMVYHAGDRLASQTCPLLQSSSTSRRR